MSHEKKEFFVCIISVLHVSSHKIKEKYYALDFNVNIYYDIDFSEY